MSYKSGFFDAQDLGEGNFDRVYNSADLAHYFSLFVGNGVFLKPTTSLQVSSQPTPNMSIKVALGSGWINGYFITVTTAETLTIPTAHGSLPRIDSILMRLDLGTRQIQLVVSPGTAASSPQPNSLIRTGNYYDLELAQVRVPAGATSITQSSIKDMRYDANRCGLVKGLIDQIDATAFFNQYQAQFNTWFENLQTNLNDDAAGFLYNQVTQIQGEVDDLKYNNQNLNMKMAEGTYQGTGAVTTKNNPKVFRFSNFKPSLMVVSKLDSITGVKMAIIHLTALNSSGLASASVLGIGQQWNNNDEHFAIKARANFRKEDQTYIVSLWEEGDLPYLNISGETYYYVAIGK